MTAASVDLGALLGSFGRLSPAQQDAVRDYLHKAWRAQTGGPVSTLSNDLNLLSTVFAPHMQAKRLRAAAMKLDRIPGLRPSIPLELFIPAADDRGFVTPEGRVLLELRAPDEQAHVLNLTLKLVRFYATPQREWIAKTLAVGGDLRPQSIGLCIFLLVNGSTDEGRALTFPAGPADEMRMASAVMGVADTFCRGVGGSPISAREIRRLRSNWVVTEAHRQLSGLVRLHDVDGLPRCYVSEGAESQLIEMLARALAKRPSLDLATLTAAIESAILAYQEIRPVLKSWGMSWEVLTHTRHVQIQLETYFVRSQALGAM